MFWKTVKLLFGNKIKGKSQIAEGNDLVANSKALVKTFNFFFVNVVASHRISMRSHPLATMIVISILTLYSAKS